MSQTFRKEITEISSQIDEQITRINLLLQKLSKATSKPPQTPPKINQDEHLLSWNIVDRQTTEQSCILNDTYQQTNYYGSTTDMSYKFMEFWENCYEEILLDDYSYYDGTLIKEISVESERFLKVSPKSNWVNTFLDEKDTIVCVEHKQTVLQILDIQNGIFKCSQRAKSKKSIVDLSRQEIYCKDSLNIVFPKLNKGIQLSLTHERKQMVYQLHVEDQQCRMFIQTMNSLGQMQRCLILKQTQEKQYDIVWGFYDRESINDCILLEKGVYILLPLPGPQKMRLYIEQNSKLSILKAQFHTLKTFTLLKRTFNECKTTPGLKRAITLHADEQNIEKQFSRSCYMNFGIIVELYENIYEHQALFVDEQEVAEDLKLLFDQIYTEEQIENRLSQKERIVKFYVITQKPAKLFVPKKKVIMGNKVMGNMKFHSVFK